MAYDNSNSKIQVKQEHLIGGDNLAVKPPVNSTPSQIIYLSSSDDDFGDDSSSDDGNGNSNSNKKRPRDSSDGNSSTRKRKRAKDLSSVLPAGFLDPLPSAATALALPSPYEELPPSPLPLPSSPFPLAADRVDAAVFASGGNRQFWKAGDYEGAPRGDWESSSGMDHARVHPKFLHSNATSHKWVLGALAELLDNSMDEVCNGATFVNIDMVKSKKDGSKMLLIEDNGGGMDPDKMRHCMSLGYSAKSNMANTIGQYGNGFKTSTMRLGADVIVFSRCAGENGRRPTQSIGLLSYTFLKTTGKEDIVVPMLDYQKQGQDWDRIIRSSATDWMLNVETIAQWSPFTSEADLLQQFNQMKDQGTRIIIYNLWEDDQGMLELDFDTDPHDIQIRGVNRDEKSIEMANKYPNSRHFLTYRHSLRSYAAILYLRIPPGFRIILRGKDVEHHNVVNDMMMSQEITYRPQPGEGIPKDINMVAVVTVGFVKDAKAHIDVQGFNVYHKNRLIKPFWRVWHPPGSDGRGVIGVLEANFVEPAHDKQGFERTIVLAKLETRLIQMQKNYWYSLCHKIGYAPRRSKKSHQRESSPELSPQSEGRKFAPNDKTHAKLDNNRHLNGKGDVRTPSQRPNYAEQSPASAEHVNDDDRQMHTPGKQAYGLRSREKSSGLRGQDAVINNMPAGRLIPATRSSKNSQEDGLNNSAFSPSSSSSAVLAQLREENLQLKERLRRKEEEILGDLLLDLEQEREKNKLLEVQLQEAERKNEELTKEQDSLIDIFSEERQRRDIEEENLRKKLKDASNTIEQLLDKMRILERMKGYK